MRFSGPRPPKPSRGRALLTTTLEPRVPPGSRSGTQLCRHSFLLGPHCPSQEEHLLENCTPCSGEFWKLEPVLGSNPPWQLQGRILFPRSSAESEHSPGVWNRASPGPAVPPTTPTPSPASSSGASGVAFVEGQQLQTRCPTFCTGKTKQNKKTVSVVLCFP